MTNLDDRPQNASRDTNPARTPLWLIGAIALAVAGFLASGAWLQHRHGNTPAADPSIPVSTLHLPTDVCPPPAPGKALAIVVYAPDHDNVRTVRCRLIDAATTTAVPVPTTKEPS